MDLEKYYLSFTLNEPIFGGFGLISGMLSLTEDCLVLEYEVKDSILGVIKSTPKKIKFQFSELISCDFNKSWFKSNLKIKTNIFLSTKGISGTNGNEINFKIQKSDSYLAYEFASVLNSKIAETYINKIDNKQYE